ncbi:lipoprotein [Megalodesulfovibrio paquesii]
MTVCLCLSTAAPSHADPLGPLDYTMHRMGTGEGPTLLVVGGIQGDEPGGFTAASLLTTRYRFTKGNVWVAPNLSFPSIVLSTRGFHGDMNRKFASLAPDDPDYKTITSIKNTILAPEVDLVLNLHDGSGFYRPTPINSMLNPARWGQSVIIDQEELDNCPSQNHPGNLGVTARHVAAQINSKLLNALHVYHVKNTETRLGDTEMEKTLTYFAITNGKPAYGIEASKDLPAAQRTYYHLLALEAFMRRMGIGYTRDFELTPANVERVINEGVSVAFYDNRIFLDLENIRSQLNYFPIKKDSDMPFAASNPLVTVVGGGDTYTVYHGNRLLTRLRPEYFEFDHTLQAVPLRIDGQRQMVGVGQMVGVREAFLVEPTPGVRVNVIGYSPASGKESEDGTLLKRTDIQNRFSVDEDGAIYRVEFYTGPKFAGMILVNFRGRQAAPPVLCTARVLTSPSNAGR